MALFDNMPYTNLHEINLDWIIEQVKKYSETVEGMSGTIDDIYGKLDDLRQFIIDQIEDLDVAAEVSAKLAEMQADGTLAQIIQQAFAQRELFIYRYGRLLDAFTKEDRERVLYIQGCCFANSRYYVCGSNLDDTLQTISIWNASGQFISSRSYTELGHAGDIAYCASKLYVATGTRVAVINATTLEIESYIAHTASLVTSIGVATDQGNRQLYILGTVNAGIMGIDKYSINSGQIENIDNNIRSYSNVKQAMCHYGGFLYLMYNEMNSMLRYNLATHSVDAQLIIPQNDGYYWTGETECPYIYDGSLCFMSANPTLTVSRQTAAIAQLFRTNALGNIYSISDRATDYQVSPLSGQINGNASYEFNPRNVFTVADEYNAIVPDLEMRLFNVNSGYIARPHNSSLTLIRSTGNGHLSFIEARQGTVMLNGITVDACNFEGCYVSLEYESRITDANIKFCDLNIINSNIDNAIDLSRTGVTYYDNITLRLDGTPTLTGGFFKEIKIRRPTLQDIYTKLGNLLSNAGTKGYLFTMIIASNDNRYVFSTILTRTNFTGNDVVLRSGNAVLTWNAESSSLTVGGAEATLSAVLDFRICG